MPALAPALVFDCSDKSLGAALIANGKILAEVSQQGGVHHSVTLLPLLENLCAQGNTSIAAMDYIAFTTGPGAFTALRIAAAVAKGFALAWHTPLVGVSTLKSLALNALNEAQKIGAPICAMIGARNGLVYTATFQLEAPAAETAAGRDGFRANNALVASIGVNNSANPPAVSDAPANSTLNNTFNSPLISAPFEDAPKSNAPVFGELTTVSPERLCLVAEALNADMAKKTIFLGDGALENKEVILNTLGENAVFAAPSAAYVQAGRLGLYAATLFAKGKLLNPLAFTPTYLQAAAAERGK